MKTILLLIFIALSFNSFADSGSDYVYSGTSYDCYSTKEMDQKLFVLQGEDEEWYMFIDGFIYGIRSEKTTDLEFTAANFIIKFDQISTSLKGEGTAAGTFRYDFDMGHGVDPIYCMVYPYFLII